MGKLPMKNELAHEHRKAMAERCLGKQRQCVLCGETRYSLWTETQIRASVLSAGDTWKGRAPWMTTTL
jgi:hypothetical protein